MRTIQLDHHYSKLRGIRLYAVRTDMSLEDLNLACAYLQLLRDQLPIFETVDDVLGEVEGVELLEKLYGCEATVCDLRPKDRGAQALARSLGCGTVTTRKWVRVNGIIDLYDNWNDYALQVNKRTALNELARVGARIAILNVMLKNALRNCASSSDGMEIVERIEAILGGALVPTQWGLKTINGDPYVGAIQTCLKPDAL